MKNDKQLLHLKKLKLARVKYFDKNHNGAEVNDIDAYAFLYENDGEYVNVFNPERELPVYGRVPYTNTTRDGEDFGTKIVLKSGEVESGPCYIIDIERCDEFFGREHMKLKQLRDYVLQSDRFFIDRKQMITECTLNERIFRYKKFQKDSEMLDKFNKFIDSHNTDIHFSK